METLGAKCQIEGCNEKGAILDGDLIYKCQNHLMEAMFDGKETLTSKSKKIKKPGRNDSCSCGSGDKFKKCCGDLNNPLRQWFLKYIGHKIWYKNGISPCPEPDCADCQTWAEGVPIQNQKHARLLFEYSVKENIQFQNYKPIANGSRKNGKQNSEGIRKARS